MRRSGWIALLSVVLLVGGYALGVATGDRTKSLLDHKDKPDQTRIKAPRNAVFALGKLQPGGGIVPIVGPPGDRIEKLLVRAGQTVKLGQTLVWLASHADRDEEVRLARQQRDEGKTQLAAILRSRAAKLSEIQQQRSAVETTAQADLKARKLKIAYLRKQQKAALARQERIAGLDESVVTVSAQEKDQVALALAQSESELEAAEAGLEAAKRKYALQKTAADASEQSVEAELDLAKARVPLGSLEQSLKLANLRREHSELKAPVSGTVVQILANEGDPTGAGSILQIAAGEGMVAVAEVYVTDVDLLRDWLKHGNKIMVKVTGPALGENTALTGTVRGSQAIALMVARNSVVGFSPRSDSDRRIVEVRVELDKDTWSQAREYVGLEVNVEFTSSSAATTPP